MSKRSLCKQQGQKKEKAGYLKRKQRSIEQRISQQGKRSKKDQRNE